MTRFSQPPYELRLTAQHVRAVLTSLEKAKSDVEYEIAQADDASAFADYDDVEQVPARIASAITLLTLLADGIEAQEAKISEEPDAPKGGGLAFGSEGPASGARRSR
jgi:hypothetical protein